MTVRGLTRSGLILSSQPVDVGIAGILQPGKAAARAVAKSGGKTVGRAQAQLTLSGSGDLPGQFANAGLFAQLRYDGPADTLWRLTGMELFDLTGPVAIGADLGGKVNDPQIRGIVEAKNARIESGVTGTLLTNVQATGRFGGSRLVIDRFAADAGKGGRVTGTGTFDLAAANGFGIDLAIRADNAVMINRDDIGATVTGPLTIKSDGQGGVIGGDLLLNKSRYRLGRATAASAVPQLNIREINLPGGGEEDDVPRKPWRLAIKARAPDQLIVSGLGLNSEWSANLQIGGAPDNPAITGRADLVRGDYEFAGRQFELERGRILFVGEVPANPSLDIAANADSTGLSATIRVTGYAQKPEISFTSTPALPEDELLSRLLFGTSITNLSAPEALQLAAAVAALRDGSGGLNPINAVRRAAGLDRLRILPADPQTGAGTSVAAGKYITRRLFAEIITDGQGYSATQVEFQVTRWLSILSSISTLGRQSANLRVSKDYGAFIGGGRSRTHPITCRANLPARHDELVPVGIAEPRKSPPGLFLRRTVELDAALAQLAIAVVDIVAGEGAVEEAADPVLMPVGREQHHAGLGARNAQLDPALGLAHRLVGHDAEAHLRRPEIKCAVLVRCGDAHELHHPDHRRLLCPRS
jgi:translocation and assembly module TamB